MNRVEKALIQELMNAINAVHQPTELQEQIRTWNQLGLIMGAITATLAYPATEDERSDVEFTTEFELECWYEDAQEWGGGCGWQQDNVEDALAMLDWCEEYRRRVVRYDKVTTMTVLGQREAEDDD